MPFLRLHNTTTKQSTAHSLRTHHGNVQGSHNSISHVPDRRARIRSSKRVSFFAFLKRGVSASMTLEASIALPFFLFAMLNIISSMNLLAVQSHLNAAMHQTGNKMAFAGYAVSEVAGESLSGELSDVILSELYARNQIVHYAGKTYLDKSCISGGSSGISMLGSEVMGDGDVIDLRVSYRVTPMFGWMGFDEFAMGQRYYAKAWTGYDVEHRAGSGSSEEDPMVYVTKSGTVYHLDRNCSYLNPAVQSVPTERMGELRNQSGGKYYPCELCGGSAMQEVCYITENGNRYHNDLNCSGLKRTIYTIPLSEVGGRGRCSKCG